MPVLYSGDKLVAVEKSGNQYKVVLSPKVIKYQEAELSRVILKLSQQLHAHSKQRQS